MLRLLIILIVLFIAFALTAKVKRLVNKSRELDKKNDGAMVKCAVCGVYLPNSDATKNAAGDFFCDQHTDDTHQDSNSDN